MDESTLHSSLGAEAARTDLRLQLLIETAHLVAAETGTREEMQVALEAGLRLTGAESGAFFLSSDERLRAIFADLPPTLFTGDRGELVLPSPHAIWALTTNLLSIDASATDAQATFRTDDLAGDGSTPVSDGIRHVAGNGFGNETGHGTQVRSCLMVPVRRRGEHGFGSLVYGHRDAKVFGKESETFLVALAAQLSLALENAVLRETLQQEAASAHAAKRKAGHRLRQALDAAELGTWSWNAASGLVDFDDRAAELFGVPPDTPLPRLALRERLLNPDDLHRSPSDLRSLLDGDGSYAAEYRVKQADGTERWIASAGNAVKDTNGRRVGMIGTLQDISPRKAQEHTLRTSEKLAATGRLAAAIAHEINNPLEAVTNLIYLAKTDPLTPAPVSRMLETADTELARVSQIAQQTLGFYRDTTRPVSVDLNDLLRAVVDLFDRKLNGKRLRCTLDLEPGLSVLGLQGEIRQVVSNLLVNAIDASGDAGGKIHIRGRHRRRDGDHGVSVLVSDEGSGIPHHVRAQLFTPFTTTKQSTGTGLGLWVTQGMVHKHGGSVRFRSRVEDPTGTVFRVFLPVSGSPHLFAHQSSPVLQ